MRVVGACDFSAGASCRLLRLAYMRGGGKKEGQKYQEGREGRVTEVRCTMGERQTWLSTVRRDDRGTEARMGDSVRQVWV